MSRQETVKYKLREIEFPTTVIGFHAMVKYCEEQGRVIEEYEEHDKGDNFNYVIIKDVLTIGNGSPHRPHRFFDILERKEYDSYGFIEGEKGSDGTYDLFMSWYNGGAGVEEVAEGAIGVADDK